jgi:hypothetical protein
MKVDVQMMWNIALFTFFFLTNRAQMKPAEVSVPNNNSPPAGRSPEIPSVSSDQVQRWRAEAKQMFYHGYDNYMQHAFPMDELDPIHCTGRGPDYAHPENINVRCHHLIVLQCKP